MDRRAPRRRHRELRGQHLEQLDRGAQGSRAASDSQAERGAVHERLCHPGPDSRRPKAPAAIAAGAPVRVPEPGRRLARVPQALRDATGRDRRHDRGPAPHVVSHRAGRRRQGRGDPTHVPWCSGGRRREVRSREHQGGSRPLAELGSACLWRNSHPRRATWRSSSGSTRPRPRRRRCAARSPDPSWSGRSPSCPGARRSDCSGRCSPTDRRFCAPRRPPGCPSRSASASRIRRQRDQLRARAGEPGRGRQRADREGCDRRGVPGARPHVQLTRPVRRDGTT